MFKLSRQQKDHRYFCGNGYEKYSIKKLKVGAASVLIGAGFLFGYNVDTVEADSATETVVTKDADTGLNQAQGNTQAGTVSEPKAELAEKPKSNAGLEKSAEPAKPVKENEKDTEQASAVSAHTNTAEATEAKPSVDLSLLQEKLADLEAQIERIRGNKKQASQIQNAEKLVAEAKQYLSALGATQSGADKKAKEISALTTILKSIKAEETVKENKNQDSRNGKKMQEGTGFRTDTATGTGISADVEDATSTPKVERPGYTNREHSEKLASQVTWLDFADKNHWTNIDEENGKIYLKEGSVYENDVYPDYRIRVRVKSLKPFQATEIYRKRMEARGATDEEKATFDPNATNQYLTRGDGQGAPARVTASAQDEWSEIRDNGINTNGKKTSIAVDKPGSNWGIQFEISASYKGKTIRPAVLMADAESANPGENIIFTTNGDGWEQIIELKKNREDAKPYTPTNLDNLHNTELTDTDVPRGVSKYNWNRLKDMMDGTTLVPVGQNGKKVALKYYANPDKETGGLETGVFGPSMTAGPYSVPVVMTKDASEVGMYVLSQGMQSAMMGVIPLDEGDAPESYGEAVHTINSKNTFTGAEVKQPYLGSNRPDPDTNSKKNWYGDDESGDADEGVNQLLPDNLKGNEGSIIKANVSIAGNYTLTIQAHTGGAEKAYVRSWIDFNKNGKFDDDEASEIATITQDGTVELNFKNKTATNVEKLLEAGTRVRISNTESEIVNPTGIAFSGEVEDFVAKITHPPKGEKKTTIGNIKETQREEIHFTAQGKNVYVREDIDAEIDATVQPTYIDNKTGQVVTLSSDGTYTVEGEGTYKFAVSDNGKDVKAEFTPADGFVGKANGISIRRQDTNKTTTNWGTNDATTLPNVNDSLNTMDGLYIPEVTPPTSISATPVNAESQNLQGFPQKGKPTFTVETSSTPVTASAKYPAKLVDPRTNTVTELTTVDAFEKGTTNKIGTYTIVPETGEVTFTPNKDFKGIPAPATISADVELTHDKDGHVTTKTLTATYTPTIIPVEPTAIASTTIGPKGKPQTSPIKLDEEETGEDKDKTVNFNKGTQEGPNRERVELDSTTLTLVNDAGAEVESVVTSDGTYTLNKAEKTITFTPNEDFVGTAKPVNVRIKDANGTKADTTYTPTVRPVTTFVDSSGTPITVDKNNTPVTPEEDGTQPNKSIYGYKFVRTETDDKGNTKHVYETVKGNVLVKYVDETGAPLAGTASIPGNATEAVTADGVKAVTEAELGTSYDNKVAEKKATKITTADGKVYELVTENNGLYNTSEPETGTVTEADKVVTFVYKEKKSAVNVKYVDKSGQPIAGTATMPGDSTEEVTADGLKPVTNASVNTDYNVEDKKASKITTADGKVYRLIAERDGLLDGSKPVSGKVEENEITVTYQYELVNGNVTVSYKDTEGNKIEGYETPKDAEKDAPTGKAFNTATEALKPAKITTPDGKVYNLVPGRTEGNENGKVTENPQNVTYVYELAKGNVTVSYKDTEGNKIPGYETPKDAEKDAPTGKAFNTATTELKPAKITMPDGKVYNLVPTRTEGNENGKVTETPQNVTYVYELAKGNVTVSYKDTEGNTIEGYETPKDAEKDAPTGKDFNTATTELKPAKITTPDGKVYNLVPGRTEGNESGKVTENPQNVTYVYELSKGDVTVKYENEAGESIKPDNNLKSQVPTGDDYNTTTVKDLTITKDGKLYKLVEKNGGVKEGSSVENGKVTETPAVVTYVYSEVKGEIIQKFVDESGKEIKDPTNTGKKSLSEKVNLEYPKRITDKNGKVYEFVKVDKIPTNFTEQPQTATYTYRAVKGQGVTVSYETTTGVTLKETQTVQPKDTVVGTDYDTSTETLKSERIEKDGKVYLLKEQTKAGSAEEKGKVSEQPQNVTYVYEEVKEPETKRNHGSVVVLYTDQSGRPISGITDKGKEVGSTVIDIANAPVNTKYDTTDNRPQTITTKDGKVYKLKKVTKNSDAEQSGVKGRTSVVTYVYEMLSPTQELPEAKIGVVLVNYQDEDGNPISGKTTEGKEVPNVVVDTDAALVDTEYDTTDHKPSVIITENGDVYELVKVSETSVEKGKVVEGTTIVDYIYRKVVTTYVDEEGKEINPSDKGTKDKKDIPEYIFKETKKDEKGNTTHVYRQVVTSYVNEEGKEISPSDKGTKDKKDIPEYIFKETKKDKDGNTIHVYTKKSSSTPYSPTPSTPSNEESKSTVWKDTEGNVLKPQEDGTKDKGTFTGYEYVKTILVGNVTTHIFKKVITPSHDGTPSHSEVPGQSDKPNHSDVPGQSDKPNHSDVTATSDKSTQIVNSNESTFVDGKRELPNTGTQSSTSSLLLGALAAITGLGLVSRRRKDDKE